MFEIISIEIIEQHGHGKCLLQAEKICSNKIWIYPLK